MATRNEELDGKQDVVAEEGGPVTGDLERFVTGELSEAEFLESRLQFGAISLRQNGVYMMRTKLPLGILNAQQLEAFADIAEVLGGGRAHLTTRQDIQTHFFDLAETPELLQVLNARSLAALKASGRTLLNITASPVAGVSSTEAFDVTPYGMALAKLLLGRTAIQQLGRKVKITLAGCDDPRYNLSAIHDIGLTATVRDGKRGFRMVVGGGLGSVPHEAQLYAAFVPEVEVLPLCQAVLLVLSAFGEKKNRAKARLKFLVAKMGIDAFRSEVERTRETLEVDPTWLAHLTDAALHRFDDRPLHPPGSSLPTPASARESQWLRTNVLLQKQRGYAAVRVRVPRGDLSPMQLRGIASLLRRHTGDTLRIGLDQSLLIRWVPSDHVLSVREALDALGLGEERSGGLGDTVSCPGADSCRLGITSPHSLAEAIQPTLDRLAQNPRLESLRIHVSGCPNSCSQHHVADIGLTGGARTVNGVASPSYLLLLGGFRGGVNPSAEGDQRGAGFGVVVGRVPAQRAGNAIELLTQLYLDEGEVGELFGSFCRRVGFARIKTLIAPLAMMQPVDEAPLLYREPGSDHDFSVRRGRGLSVKGQVDPSDQRLTDDDRETD